MKLQPLISAAELAKRLSQDNILIVDCRFDLAVDLIDPDKAEQDYRAGHIPGAVYAHLNRDLSDLSKQKLGRHPLPDDEAFSATLGRWGWASGIPIVAYDDANGALAAARLWWMLRLAAIDNIAVLDGGLAAWRTAQLSLETGSTKREATTVKIHFDRTQVVGFEEVERRLQDDSMFLLDARAAPRYRGEVEPLDPAAGHVPGAQNRPFSTNLQTDGRFKAATELRGEFESLLNGREASCVVHMCGSGVTACHNLLAMEHAGLSGSRVFAPSWSGWISDSKRPTAKGET